MQGERRSRSGNVARVGGTIDPSDIQLTPGQQMLYRRIVPECNPVKSLIAGYDNILTHRIAQVLDAHRIYGSKDTAGRYSVYRVVMDKWSDSDIKSEHQAQLQRKSLETNIYVRVERTWRNADGSEYMEDGEVVRELGPSELLTTLPIPRGSLPDRIASRREARYEAGDEPLLPQGYFILDGSRQYIVLYNKLKYDMPITYAKKDDVMTTVICTTPDMSTVQINVFHDAENLMLCRTSILGSTTKDNKSGNGKQTKLRFIFLYEYMSVLMTRQLEGGLTAAPSASEVTDLILSFIPEVHRPMSHSLLLLSEGTLKDRSQVLENIKSTIKLAENLSTIERRLVDEVYPAIPNANRELKARQLAYVASRHVLYLIGVYQAHDRDAPALYRMDCPEIVITKLFADKYRAAIDGIKSRGGGTGVEDLLTATEVARSIAKEESITKRYKTLASVNILSYLTKIRDEIRAGFKKGNFGGKNIKNTTNTNRLGSESVEQKGIIARLETANFSSAWSQMTHRGVPSSSKGSNIKVRSGHPGRVGYEDLTKSPDNKMIGLTMFLSSTCWISRWRTPSVAVDAVLELARLRGLDGLPQRASADAPDLVLVAGVIQGYADGKWLVRELHKLRENRHHPLHEYFDAMFFYDEFRGEVQILTDAGRLVRPLLVVDGDRLVIEKKRIAWDSPLDYLMETGCVRMVDSYEAGTGALAAQFPDYFRMRWDEVRIAEGVRDELVRLTEGSEGTVSGVKIDQLLTSLIGYRVAYKRGVKPVVEHVDVPVLEAVRQIALLDEYITKARSLIQYNYCEIDADVLMGFSSAIIPYLNHTSGTKQAYAAHMATQAVGQSTPNYLLSNTATLRILNNGQRGMTETGMSSIVGVSHLPASQNAIVAISSGTAYGDYGGGIQEDAIQLSQSAVDRGLFSYTIHKRVTYTQNVANSATVRSSRPTGPEYDERYMNLDRRGVVRKGTEVRDGDVIYSLETQTSNGRWKRRDFISRGGDVGIVTDVFYIESPLYILVTLSEVRQPVAGSKLSTMHANKGVAVEVTPDSDMPIDEVTGMKPDVIIHAVGISPRGTVGLLIEMMAASASALRGQRTNASGMSQDVKVEQFAKVLSNAGLHPAGEYKLKDRRTGTYFRGTVFMGIAQMQLINKTVEEDSNWVGVVTRHPWNMQPVKGKRKGGGIRMGVSEGDALAYHGMESMRHSVYYKASDGITVPVCNQCGQLASVSKTVGQYECHYCLSTLSSSESHLGRDIVRVEMAGSWRHIQQVLLMRGIQVTHQLRPKGQLAE